MLTHDLIFADQIDRMNELTQQVQRLESHEKLTQYKALLVAIDCHDVDTAISLADSVDDYLFTPGIRTPEDAARKELQVILDDSDAQLLIKYLNLHDYGIELMERQNSLLTQYGMIERQDGHPILTHSDIPAQEMQML
jgi:hypothetical protein